MKITEIRAENYNQTLEHSNREILTRVSSVVVRDAAGDQTSMVMLPGIYLDGMWSGGNPLAQRRIVIVSCWPNQAEAQANSLGRGVWVDEFRELADLTGFPRLDCYYTTFVKFHAEGAKKGAISKELVAEFLPILQSEIKEVNPELVILLGARSLKGVFGAHATLERYNGRTISAAESPLGIKTTTIPDFSAILATPEIRPVIKLELARIAAELLNTSTPTIQEDYVYCSTFDECVAAMHTIEEQYKDWLSVDCEWAGPNYLEGELRTIQFSWAPGKAAVLIFNKADMVPTELMERKSEVWALIKALVENGKTKLIGHFIRADLPWIKHNGVDIEYATMHGWDTGLAGHLLNENWPQGLEVYTARHTNMGRYDVELMEWIKDNHYCVEEKAYGGIPDDILLPYAAKDADATFRIFLDQLKEINKPGNEKIKALYENVVMPVNVAILEMEMEGMVVDLDRLELLSHKYTNKRESLADKLRLLLNWPEFNPDSPQQKVAALFGINSGKSSSPAGALLRSFTPIKSTAGKKWENKKSAEKFTPSADRSVLLDLLLQNKDDEVLNTLLLYTAVSQTVKTFTGTYVDDLETGIPYVQGGLIPKMWSDKKVHTRIRQTLETGRYGHSDPNLAQLPKTAEDLVGKAFEAEGKGIPSVRSCFTVEPGWCLLDCDWVQAELFVMAWLSADSNMQKKLSDKTADFHSEVAIEMFRLEQPPEDYAGNKKEWLKEKGYSKYRTIAKTITFGIAYGRGAAAIQQAVYREGINITVDEAQEAIDKFKTTFPQLAFWLGDQQDAVTRKGYVENGFGRRRRFEATEDPEILGHHRRQAMNAPIQGTVGDLMSMALLNLYLIRKTRPHLNYKLQMSVHDQILLTCPLDQIEETLKAMKVAMCDACRIPGNELLLSIDPEVCLRWGEPLTEEDVTKYPQLKPYRKS